MDTNIRGTLNILQAARDLNLSKVIHTSTSEVYGSAQFVPITENHPVIGQSPYSATKIAADQLAFSFTHHLIYLFQLLDHLIHMVHVNQHERLYLQ